MVYVRERKKEGKKYYELVETVRKGNKVKQKFIAYFGTRKPSPTELVIINKNLEGNDRVDIKKPLLTKEEIDKIEAANKEIKNRFKPYTESEKKNFFEKKFYVDFIYNTNAIEGSTITREETNFILETGQAVEGKPLRDANWVENMENAINYTNNYKGDLTTKFIKELNKRIDKNNEGRAAGEYKRVPNYIANHLPTHPIFVEKRMKQEVRWYNRNKTKFHSFEIAAIMHNKFVTIHPFEDGNGRTARMIHNFILQKNDHYPIIFTKEKQQQYYLALRIGQEYKNYRTFLEYVLGEFGNTFENYTP